MARKKLRQEEALFDFENGAFQINEELTNDSEPSINDVDAQPGRPEGDRPDAQRRDGADLDNPPVGVQSGLVEDPGAVPVGQHGGGLQPGVRPGADDARPDPVSPPATERSVRGRDDEQPVVQAGNEEPRVSEQIHPRGVQGRDGLGQATDVDGDGRDQPGSSEAPGAGRSAVDERRDSPGSAPVQDSSSETVDEALPERSGPVPSRYTGEPGLAAPKNERERVHYNLDALELLNTLNDEHRWPTAEEQAVLSRYASWGGASKVFEEFRPEWEEERTRLKSLVDADTYRQLSATTLNAHFTPDELASSMWSALEQAGFSEGQVLEPGSGKGTFIKHAPAGAQMIGVEIDTVTAQISSFLAPDAQIHRESFGTFKRENESFHAVIGNVPFGDFRVPDPKHNPGRYSIHNHFINKSLQLTAPGGYVAVVTSSYTMDGQRATARNEMMRHGDLVGAVRLPNGAFRASAGTDVMADVLVFRAREKDRDRADDAWLKTGDLTVGDDTVSVNQYFLDHPENVLGQWQTRSTPYGGRTAAVSNPDMGGLGSQLEVALSQIVQTAKAGGLGYGPQAIDAPDYEPGLHTETVLTHAVGHVRHEGQVFQSYEADGTWSKISVPKAAVAESRRLLELRDGVVNLIDLQRTHADPQHVADERAALMEKYESYVQDFGPVNRAESVYRTPSAAAQKKELAKLESAWRDTLPDDGDIAPDDVPVPEELAEQWRDEVSEERLTRVKQDHLKFLKTDAMTGLLTAIERYDAETGEAEPGDVLLKDVVDLRARPESAATAQAAVAISMDELGRIDVERVAELLSIDQEQALKALEPLSFKNPENGELVPSVVYLSGLVRDKLDAAEVAAAENPDYQRNVDALKDVLPPDIPIEDISVNPGVRYVSAETYTQFVRETLQLDAKVSWNEASSSWEMEKPKKHRWDPKVQFDFGTDHRRPDSLMLNALNGTAPVVTFKDVDGKSVKNDVATTAAREKLEKLKTEFRSWVVADPERAKNIENSYNRAFNSLVAPDYAQLASEMAFSGLAQGREPYAYQRAAVARVINEPAVLLDHVVGAGKTGTMVMSCMELRRTGIANKPAIVVPNHLVEQVGREFNEWYPGARVLTIATGVDAVERTRAVAQASAGDWDAVVIPQTTFEKIKIDPLRTAEWLEQDIEALKSQIPGADEKHTKELEREVKKLEERYDKATAQKDPGVTWEQTGIDYLFVDEAHNYKNLGRTAPLKELSCGMTNRAQDLDHKLRTMREAKTEAAIATGRYSDSYIPAVATFATGTPVANNMSEMWVMQHYLRPDLLARADVDSIGAWATAFTVQGQVIRPKPAGGGYDQIMKVKEYVNVPELVGLSAQFTDVVTTDQLTAKLPTLRSGERLLKRREPEAAVQEFIAELQERAEALKGTRPEKGGDNMLNVVNDGRNVALASELAGLDPEEDGGRARQVAATIMAEHRASQDKQFLDAHKNPHPVPGGLQIVFADRATPKPDGSFSIYTKIKQELVDLGMEPERIAFIHDAKNGRQRDALFEKCRTGQVNVIIGSTEKMGTGTNIQARAIALHHVDVPWRPADVEQREGRVIRQGNQNDEIEIFQYATDQTFDVYMHDVIAKKASFIKQLKVGAQVSRTAEDPFGGLDMSAARASAALSGDPRLLQLAELESAVKELEQLEAAHTSAKQNARASQGFAKSSLDSANATIADLERRIPDSVSTQGESFRFTSAAGEVFTDRVEAANHIRHRMLAALNPGADPRERTLGTLGGHEFVFIPISQMDSVQYGIKGSPHSKTLGRGDLGGAGTDYGVVTRLENFVSGLPAELERQQGRIEDLTGKIDATQQVLDSSFDRAAELQTTMQEYKTLLAELGEQDEKRPGGNELSRDQMILLYEELPEGRISTVARDGDVVYHDKNNYRIAASEDGNLYGFDLDAEPDAENIKLQHYAQVSILSRSMDSLTEHEKRVLEFNRDHDVVTHDRQSIEDGDRVSADLRQQGGGTKSVTGVVRAGGRDFYPDSSPENAVPFITVGAVLRVDVTNPEKIAAEQALREAERSKVRPNDLLPGDVFVEDVPYMGAYAGDVMRLQQRYGGLVKIPASSDTGVPRESPRYQERGLIPDHIQRISGRDLTKEEQRMIFPDPMITVNTLRGGDAVRLKDLDTSKTDDHPVRVLDVSGNYSSKITVKYLDDDGSKVEVARRDDQQIEVLARRHGALNAVELSYLAGAEHGAQKRLANSLNPEDQGKYLTGINRDNGQEFHGVFQSIDEYGNATILDADFKRERHSLTSSSRLVLSDQDIPLTSLAWNATSSQNAAPEGQRAEPERVEVTETDVAPATKTAVEREQHSTNSVAAASPANRLSHVLSPADHHRPPMPPTGPDSAGPGLGM